METFPKCLVHTKHFLSHMPFIPTVPAKLTAAESVYHAMRYVFQTLYDVQSEAAIDLKASTFRFASFEGLIWKLVIIFLHIFIIMTYFLSKDYMSIMSCWM
jgi:hypothetical protein